MALADASGGRFVLGLGSSSDVIVERWNERPFAKPPTRVRESVQVLREILGGRRTWAGGFKLETPHPVPIVIAALRDRMLRLGASSATGRSSTAAVVGRARRRACARARPAVTRRRSSAASSASWRRARRGALHVRRLRHGTGLRGVLPGARLGRRDRPDGGRLARGRPQGRVAEVPDELVREIFILGDPVAMKERLGAFAERGITTLVLTLIGDPDLIEALAS